MGELTIHFEGICTHINLPGPVEGHERRTVLVHAEYGRMLYGQAIPPHLGYLIVDPENILAQVNIEGLLQQGCLLQQPDGNWQLFGARLRLLNQSEADTLPLPAPLVPSLLHLTPDFGPLSSTVVFGTDAACHVDIGRGALTSTTGPMGSVWCTLAARTTDDHPILLIDSLFRNPHDGTPLASGSLTLTSGAAIIVTNTAASLQDKKYDFYLHYLTAETLPLDAGLPPETLEKTSGKAAVSRKGARAKIMPHDSELGPGCSNANFP